MKRLGAVLCAALMAGALVACGGDDDGSTAGSTDTAPRAEDFAAQANAVCVEANQDLVEVNLDLGYLTNARIEAEQAEQLLLIRERTLSALSRLEPPVDQAETFDQYLNERRELVDATEALQVASESGDRDEVEEADADVTAALRGAVNTAEDLGLDDCEGVLPDDDAEAAEAALLAFLNADPAESCSTEGAITAVFLESLGGITGCEKLQVETVPNDGRGADSFAVTGAKGINDAIASLEYEEVGGGRDGERAEATLYCVDGEWRIFSIFATG